jgi:excisionase family DNA binding protein
VVSSASRYFDLLDGRLHSVTTMYMTTEEVAQLARTSPETVRYWRHVGRGPGGHFRVGRRVLYDRATVEAWLASLRDAAAGGTPAA